MLRIDLGALRHGPIDMTQTVPTDDPLFQELEFSLGQPVRLSGRLMDAGPGRYYWHGRLQTRVDAACRRCLAPVAVDVDQAVDILFTEDARSEDPAAYVIPPKAMEIDPTEAVREELILAAPEYVLCSEDCRGICAGCGTDLNTSSCTCKAEPDPRWAALQALKIAQHNGERE